MDQNKIEYSKPVPPFVRYCSAIIPTAFDDSLSYYEALCALWKWMQTNLVDVINNNANVTDYYIQIVRDLKSYVENYFDNLDVQEEINNKLDEMTEDGTLQEIIGSYLNANAVWGFDNVADMMSSTNLIEGSYAETLGYYSVNDGGGATYKIVSSGATADGGSIIALNNGLKAQLIVKNNTVSVNQFGAKGDGTTDDSNAIKNALAFRGNDEVIVSFDKAKTYLAQGKIYLYSNTTIELNNATIKDCKATQDTTDYNDLRFMNNIASTEVEGYGALKNIIVRNGTLDGNNCGVMFALMHADNCTFENIYFNKAMNVTHVLDMGGCSNILIKNCDFDGDAIATASHSYRECIQPDYADYTAMPYWGDDASIAFDELPSKDITIDGCSFKKKDTDTYHMNAIGTHSIRNTAHSNITVKNCVFYGCEFACIRFRRVDNLLIEGNTFYSTRANRTGADFFAIDVRSGAIGDYDNYSDNGITIRNNTYKALSSEDDMHFIGIKGLNMDYPFNNILIEGNTYYGTTVDEANYVGKDFAHLSNLVGVIVKNNNINNSKQGLWIPANDQIKNLTFEGNVLNNVLRPVRGSTGNLAINPSGFNYGDNVYTSPVGSLETSSFRVVLKLDSDSDITVGGSNTNYTIPLKVVKGYPFFISDNNEIRIPSFIKKIRVSGFMKYKTTNSGTFTHANIYIGDRYNNSKVGGSYNQISSQNDSTWKTAEFIPCVWEDKDFISYYASDSDLLWKDGRFYLMFRFSATQPVTIGATDTDTNIIIEGF